MKKVVGFLLLFILANRTVYAAEDSPYLKVTSGKNTTRSAAFGKRDWQDERLTDENREINLSSNSEYTHSSNEEEPWWSMTHSKAESYYNAGSVDGTNEVTVSQCIYSRSESDGTHPSHGYALTAASGHMNIFTGGYPAEFEVTASYNTGCDSNNTHCVGQYGFEGFSIELINDEGSSFIKFPSCKEGCGQDVQTQKKTFLVKNKDHFSFVTRFKGSSVDYGVVNGCVDIEFRVKPVEFLKVTLKKAKMVSRNELGVAAEIEYPDKFADQPRWLKLTLRRKGEKYQDYFDVSDLTVAGEKVVIGVDPENEDRLDPESALRFNLEELDVPRFSGNESYLLDGAATYWEDEQRPQPKDTQKIKVLSPTIFVHGYNTADAAAYIWKMKKESFANKNMLARFILRWYGKGSHFLSSAFIVRQKSALFGSLTGKTWKEPFLTGYADGHFVYYQEEEGGYSQIDLPEYQTLWFKFWPFDIKPDEGKVCNWFNSQIAEVMQNTWAGKVNIVSHSAGGLLSRYYLNECPRENRTVRLVMVGAPNKGTLMPFQLTDKFRLTLPEVEELFKKTPVARWTLPDDRPPGSREGYNALYLKTKRKGQKWSYDPDPLELSIKNNFPLKDISGAPEGMFYSSIFTTGEPTPSKFIVELTCPKDNKNCSESEAWYNLDTRLTKTLIGEEAYDEGDGSILKYSSRIWGNRTRNVPVDKQVSHLFLFESKTVLEKIYQELTRNVGL